MFNSKDIEKLLQQSEAQVLFFRKILEDLQKAEYAKLKFENKFSSIQDRLSEAPNEALKTQLMEVSRASDDILKYQLEEQPDAYKNLCSALEGIEADIEGLAQLEPGALYGVDEPSSN